MPGRATGEKQAEVIPNEFLEAKLLDGHERCTREFAQGRAYFGAAPRAGGVLSWAHYPSKDAQ